MSGSFWNIGKAMLAGICYLLPAFGYAQNGARLQRRDTLPEVQIKAYYSGGSAMEMGASISLIDSGLFEQFNNVSILQAVNTTPGVLMEERSPGSYRFGIRGSALGSPYGIRNIKVYYNNIPFTEPGGTSYLNALGTQNCSSMEIIKGPGSSVYGASVGGVLLISSGPQSWNSGISLSASAGSYGMLNLTGTVAIGDTNFQNTIRFQHLQSNGYRTQSKMTKDIGSYDVIRKLGKRSTLDLHLLYSNLWYETPGALTQAEFELAPESSRPATNTAPSAVDSKAAIFQKMLLAGATARQDWNRNWTSALTIYGTYVSLDNPNLRNFSQVQTPYYGARVMTEYKRPLGKGQINVVLGTEAQQGFTKQKVYDNNGGIAAAVQSETAINIGQLTGFAQLGYKTKEWVFTLGSSINHGALSIVQRNNSGLSPESSDYNQWAPRLAIVRRLNSDLSVYTAVDKGFSPASADAIAPTGSMINSRLNPEQGWNYEVGLRGYAFQRHLQWSVTVFYFQLNDKIIPRRDSAGGDYYVNAGSTDQKGVEIAIQYGLIRAGEFVLKGNLSFTGNNFKYREFAPLDKNYAGKLLPGVAPNTITAGLTAVIYGRLKISTSVFNAGIMWLNDANTAAAAAYTLLGTRLSYLFPIKRGAVEIFAGGDNLLNEQYSLGNDLNAAGGRYYNAAAPRTYYAGLVFNRD